MAGYPFKAIEEKWQRYWESDKTFSVAALDKSRPKFYVLDMFPYPSGAGLHVGHPEGYTATDILARYKRMRGFNVLHPMGWDAFGLPAEQYAIKTGHASERSRPREHRHLPPPAQALGFSYDWDREVDTTDPAYYRWTQWIFLQLFERGLAFQDENPGQLVPGARHRARQRGSRRRQERGRRLPRRAPADAPVGAQDHGVRRRAARRASTASTGRRRKEMQRNWIGRSEGAEVDFALAAGRDSARRSRCSRRGPTRCSARRTWCSRPSTRSSTSSRRATSAPPSTPIARRPRARATWSARSCRRTRPASSPAATPSIPLNGEQIPIWIADYVLVGYGTGAIMAVPAHDERDFEFATQVRPCRSSQVVSRRGELHEGEAAYTGDGHEQCNSGTSRRLGPTAARSAHRSRGSRRTGIGARQVNYKLRDWLFSRQRYWGEPFPICFVATASRASLYPTIDIAASTLPRAGGLPARAATPERPAGRARATGSRPSIQRAAGRRARETNTMPQWAGSCWYYLRYLDPKNADAARRPGS